MKSRFGSRHVSGAAALLLVGSLVSAACDGGESNTDNAGGGGAGGEASGGRPAGDGGAPEGGAGGEAPTGGADSTGGTSSTGGGSPLGGAGGEGPADPIPFTGFFWINNEYESDPATRALEVKGTFAEPEFDVDAFESTLSNEFATLGTLEPGECGAEALAVSGTVPSLLLSYPVLRDGTDDLLVISNYFDGFWHGFLYGEDGDDIDSLLDTPLDFFLNASDDVPAVTAEDWGVIPIATNPSTTVQCLKSTGCTLAADITSDDLFIQFGTSLGRRYCRGNADATSVTIPSGLPDQNTSAQIFYIRRHDVALGESTIRIVIQTSGESFPLRAVMPS